MLGVVCDLEICPDRGQSYNVLWLWKAIYSVAPVFKKSINGTLICTRVSLTNAKMKNTKPLTRNNVAARPIIKTVTSSGHWWQH